ncbi:MAG: radical SAM protein [Peptococcaceae bacterium]|jgi:radical SAM superfamily enzyme YgiQ (UPF0313 family)|nr:radical SAM protein [Peptococcaceae bacterium]
MHYTGTIWRPPYEADSLLLEVTAGCTHHKCKFCTLYAELPFKFRMSPLADVENDLLEARAIFKQQQARGLFKLWPNSGPARVFLTGANPFVLKAERLLEIAGMIARTFPEIASIGCFARVTDVALKTEQELAQLRAAGFDGLTLGVETGDDVALAFMRKGYQAADIVEQCQRLEAAGIGYNFFYLTGISGHGRGQASAKATAAVCNQLHPRRIGASMLTIYPNSELYQEIQNGAWQPETEIEKYQELKTLVQALQGPVWFGALGASNAVPFAGNLPGDKERLLAVLDEIIADFSEEELQGYRQNLRHL